MNLKNERDDFWEDFLDEEKIVSKNSNDKNTQENEKKDLFFKEINLNNKTTQEPKDEFWEMVGEPEEPKDEFWNEVNSITNNNLPKSEKCSKCNNGIIYDNPKNKKCSNYLYDFLTKTNVGTCDFIEWKNDIVFLEEKCPKCNNRLIDKPKFKQCEKRVYNFDTKQIEGTCDFIEWKNEITISENQNKTILEEKCSKCNGNLLDFPKKIQCENYKFDMKTKNNVGTCSFIQWKNSF